MIAPSGRPALHILVVDDSDAQRYVLCTTLSQEGFLPHEARTGAEALELARTLQPDVILLDVQLPDVDGYEVCRRLKADPRTASIPVVQLSAAFITSADRVEGLRGGAEGFLVAPVNPSELSATLHTLTRAHELARERLALLEAERDARHALERANAQLALQATILASVGHAVIVSDAQGIITQWNAGAEAIFGYTEAEALGRSVAMLYPEREEDRLAPRLEEIAGGQDARQDWRGRRKDGSDVWLDIHTRPVRDASGQVVGFVGVSKDVTEERRRAEYERQVVGIVSHDLRNPLQAVLMSAELAARPGVSPETRERALERIRASAGRARRLIDDLLDLTRVRQGGGIAVRRRPTELAALVRHALEEARVTAPGRALELRLEGDTAGDWDPDRLAQVVQNLIGNALEHTPPDVPVTVRLEGSADRVLLEVHNAGAPIAEQDLPRLFEPYQRGREAHGPGGLGLGLFITRHVVEAHGGQVEVRSSADDGTTFRVTLPRRAAT